MKSRHLFRKQTFRGKLRIFCNMMKIIFASWIIIRTFALAFESESCKQEKHCDIVLAFEFAKFKKEDGAFMLSLDCVCYIPVAYLQA